MTEPTKPTSKSSAIAIVLVVVALFAGIMLAKVMAVPAAAPVVDTSSTGSPAAVSSAGRTTITSTHNDAVADYDAALETGKPVYLLFHSLTCEPCVEISAVADKVLPDYEDSVVFVNAISDDASAKQLAARFQFQYIPTSFFLTPDGKVADSFTGSMSDADMRARLDKLIAR